jgi:ribose/xylose/arabinose/galactoside ABC-type transport system permease subunit
MLYLLDRKNRRIILDRRLNRGLMHFACLLSADTAKGLTAGRWLGASVVIVGAACVAMNGTEQWKAGHVGLAIAYWSSAVAGAVRGTCVTCSALTSWILTLTILRIAIGLVIMYFNERELKEFLGRSYFGTNNKDDKYRSLAEEQTGYAGLGA